MVGRKPKYLAVVAIMVQGPEVYCSPRSFPPRPCIPVFLFILAGCLLRRFLFLHMGPLTPVEGTQVGLMAQIAQLKFGRDPADPFMARPGGGGGEGAPALAPVAVRNPGQPARKVKNNQVLDQADEGEAEPSPDQISAMKVRILELGLAPHVDFGIFVNYQGREYCDRHVREPALIFRTAERHKEQVGGGAPGQAHDRTAAGKTCPSQKSERDLRPGATSRIACVWLEITAFEAGLQEEKVKALCRWTSTRALYAYLRGAPYAKAEPMAQVLTGNAMGRKTIYQALPLNEVAAFPKPDRGLKDLQDGPLGLVRVVNSGRLWLRVHLRLPPELSSQTILTGQDYGPCPSLAAKILGVQRLLNTLQRKAEKTAERNRLSTQCTKISRQSAVKAKTLKNFLTNYQQFFVLGSSTKFFDSLFSIHDNGNEDRIWKWTESDIGQADKNRGVSIASGFGQSNAVATAYDVKWTFECPPGQAMVAFAAGAFRRNNERDRRWRYQCRGINGLRTQNPSVYAAWTDWVNDWDKDFEFPKFCARAVS
eukprot:s1794_g25.t1